MPLEDCAPGGVCPPGRDCAPGGDCPLQAEQRPGVGGLLKGWGREQGLRCPAARTLGLLTLTAADGGASLALSGPGGYLIRALSFGFAAEVCGIISQPGIKPTSSAVGALSPTHWTTRKPLSPHFLEKARRSHGVGRRPPRTSPKGPLITQEGQTFQSV